MKLRLQWKWMVSFIFLLVLLLIIQGYLLYFLKKPFLPTQPHYSYSFGLFPCEIPYSPYFGSYSEGDPISFQHF